MFTSTKAAISGDALLVEIVIQRMGEALHRSRRASSEVDLDALLDHCLATYAAEHLRSRVIERLK